MSKSLFDLSGRTALVTGASRGIGAALALGLAEAGADLVLTARKRSSLEHSVEKTSAYGRKVLPIEMDVRSEASINDAFTEIQKEQMMPSILINNAGIEQVCPSADVTPDLFDQIIGTNLRGAFFVAQAIARSLLSANKQGSIVNLCSLTSEVGVPTAAPYTASKSGLLGLTRALASEWAGNGIRVNGLGPGYFRTDLTETFYEDQNWQEAMLEKIPMRRFGQMEDLIGACIFLSSSASAYMTGQVIYVDGGYLASI